MVCERIYKGYCVSEDLLALHRVDKVIKVKAKITANQNIHLT